MRYFTFFKLKFDTAKPNNQTFWQLAPSAKLPDDLDEILCEM